MTTHPVTAVKEAMEHGLFEELYGGVLPDHIRWLFDPSEPSMEDITHALTAYLELHGDYPHLIIVDNLLNCRNDSQEEWGGLRKLMKDFHFLARKTRAAVIVLHHTQEESGLLPQGRDKIQGKLVQLPALILLVSQDGGEMFVVVAKQRNGPSDKDAKEPIRMIIDFTRMRLWDLPQGRSVTL